MVNHPHNQKNVFFDLALLVGLVCLTAGQTTAVEKTATKSKVVPLKVLMVTGGSSHDYENQKGILEKGIAARANVQWTIAHQGGNDRNQMIELFNSADWAAKYDIVVHNQCFGGVTDVAFVERVAQAHYAGAVSYTHLTLPTKA